MLDEKTNRGATILEKFERHAQEVDFAVVLLTGDDEGRLRGSDDQVLRNRGRQNVILEAGAFIGRLGRDRVAIIRDPGVEDPSDLDGLLCIALDNTGMWRYELLRELAAAGAEIDWKRALTQ